MPLSLQKTMPLIHLRSPNHFLRSTQLGLPDHPSIADCPPKPNSNNYLNQAHLSAKYHTSLFQLWILPRRWYDLRGKNCATGFYLQALPQHLLLSKSTSSVACIKACYLSVAMNSVTIKYRANHFKYLYYQRWVR